jgi:Fe-S-cluster containining protein
MGKECLDKVCNHCGSCCSVKVININLSAADIWRICSHLDISVDEFFKKYGGLKLFGDPRNPEIFDLDIGLEIPCKFRENNRCAIYDARPVNCRIFPYWVFTTVPEDKLKDTLGTYRCSYNLKNKKAYKKYEQAVSKILLEEAKLFEINKQVEKGYEIKEKIPINEIKKAIALNLNKISRNSEKLKQAEKILK